MQSARSRPNILRPYKVQILFSIIYYRRRWKREREKKKASVDVSGCGAVVAVRRKDDGWVGAFRSVGQSSSSTDLPCLALVRAYLPGKAFICFSDFLY